MYKNKYSAQESLERIKLMMEYDVKKTATENIMEQAQPSQSMKDLRIKTIKNYLSKLGTDGIIHSPGDVSDGQTFDEYIKTWNITPEEISVAKGNSATTANDNTNTTAPNEIEPEDKSFRKPSASKIGTEPVTHSQVTGPAANSGTNVQGQELQKPENQLATGKGLFDGLVARAGITGTPEEKEPYVTKNFGRIRYFGQPIQNFEALGAYITSLGYKQMKEKDGKIVWVKQ